MMETGFSSPRNDAFPVGLRVLVVDDDPIWLKILKKMLKKCSYEVTTCGLARDALSLLRERKDGYDIVIIDVNMPDMDGFKLLEHVGLDMDLPVIMMSVDGETSRVMKGIQHGACDYLLKPIRMKELQNIWQHAFRRRIQEASIMEGMESSSVKKDRVVWSVDVHQKFIKAICQIGFDKAGPKKIMHWMNITWLTRENIATHLQIYRLYLSRLQKHNDLKPSSAGYSGTQNSYSYVQESYASNHSYGFDGQQCFNYGSGSPPWCQSSGSISTEYSCNMVSRDGFFLQNVELRSYESDEEETVLMAVGPSAVSESSESSNSSTSVYSRTDFGNPSNSNSSGSDVNNIGAFDSPFLFGPKPESSDK